MKLYHYVHCPFCVRVRLALGLLEIPFESKVLSYADEETPKQLTGVKMLPIFDFGQGLAINESLDIIKRLDEKNQLKLELLESSLFSELNAELEELGKSIHNLAMPYWVWTPEFDEESRSYFVAKKSAKRGPFHLLLKKADAEKKELVPKLWSLEEKLSPWYGGEAEMTILDIMLAAHLWGLYIVPEFQFSSELHQYLQCVKEKCHFVYHADFQHPEVFLK